MVNDEFFRRADVVCADVPCQRTGLDPLPEVGGARPAVSQLLAVRGDLVKTLE